MKKPKLLLFHAFQPDFITSGSHDWNAFLRDASLVPFPTLGERLATNVWLFPEDHATERALAQAARRWSIATRIRAFVGASDWQPLPIHP